MHTSSVSNAMPLILTSSNKIEQHFSNVRLVELPAQSSFDVEKKFFGKASTFHVID